MNSMSPDSLPELVECGAPSCQQGFAIRGSDDTLRTATERMLQGGNHLRNRGGRYAELGAGLGHAAVLHHGEEDEQITQPQSAADLVFPLNQSRHKEFA